MNICKSKNVAFVEIFFGLAIFLIILFAMQEQIILLFEQNELYKALTVTLGGITVASSIAIISSFFAVWIVENIGKAITIASIVWAIKFIIV